MMSIRASLLIATACVTTAASAQPYYIPFEIPMPPEINRLGLGFSFGADGNTIYIGDIGNRFLPDTAPSGVYQFDLNTFDLLQTYEAVGHPYQDIFGFSMEYYDGVLLVGAPLADNDFGQSFGKAYLINPFNGAIIHTFDEDPNGTSLSSFASDVSINDVAVVIGATGYNPNFAGRVFVYNASTNALVTSLTPEPGTGDTDYGHIVDHNDQYLAVAAPGSRFDAIPGAVYIYDFVTGALLHRIVAPFPDPNGSAHFGTAMDLEGDKVYIGSGDFAPNDIRGKVFVYDIPTGNLVATLTNDTGSIFDRFGQSLSVEGNTIVISASRDEELGFETGAVYIFDANTYELIDKVLSPNTSRHIAFGRNVKIQDGTIFATSFLDTPLLNERAVLILREFCRPDINLDGDLNFLDVSAFLKFAVDFNEDGSFNFLDISAFLQSFAEGCP